MMRSTGRRPLIVKHQDRAYGETEIHHTHLPTRFHHRFMSDAEDLAFGHSWFDPLGHGLAASPNSADFSSASISSSLLRQAQGDKLFSDEHELGLGQIRR